MFKNDHSITKARLITDNESLIVCPICWRPMKAVPFKSLVCAGRHCFDLSRHGYINFLTHPPKTKYDKSLFASRKEVNESGFFEPLMDRLYEAVLQYTGARHERMAILDAGCGEGSHLSHVLQRFKEQPQRNVLGVGIDISKEGVQMAARRASEAIWCVADLARCPFADRRFDVILNVLSPSNYAEFRRMLADDGIVIKVIPEREHLQELRAAFYGQTDRRAYSNENTIERFRRQFELLDIRRARYIASIDPKRLASLIRMTPLSWRVPEALIQQVLDNPATEITFDFAVLIGSRYRRKTHL